MPMPRVPIDRDKLIALYARGLSYEQIARELNTNGAIVYSRLREWRLIGTVPRHGSTWRRDLDGAEISRRYVAGASEKALADTLGISRSAVRTRLIEAGVQPRTQAESEALKWTVLKRDRRAVERQCSAAWAAARGRVQPLAELLMKAKTRAARLSHVGRHEDALRIALRKCGVLATPQFQVGPYNLDLSLRKYRVAVEILTAYLDAAKSVSPKRMYYLFDRGWAVLILYCPTSKGAIKADALAQHVIAFAQATRRDPTARRQYGVIGGDGQPISASRFQRYDGTRVDGF